MYAAINGVNNNKSVYIMQSFRKQNGKTSTKVVRSLGKYNDLLIQFNNDKDKLMEWAKSEALKETEKYNKENENVVISYSPNKIIEKNVENSFNVGYLFLQSLCTDLRLDNICRNITNKYKFEYDIHAILTDLIYARILSPSSKNSSYEYVKTLLEPPKYSTNDMYRSLSILANESEYIQEELYRNSNFIHPRNTKVLYYDCTNYFFEIEDEEDDKQYGKSKENRPNPIVGMGLFMDTDGIPLAFDIFPGNKNEQVTLKPIESRIIKDFECSDFVYCSDAGLGSKSNKQFNNVQGRHYVITQSLKKLKEEDKKIVFNTKQYRKLGSNKFIDLKDLDETNPEVYESIYYKEIPVYSKELEENLIVTYSPKYKAYLRNIRNGQIERAQSMISHPSKISKKRKNPNDPARFINEVAHTEDGEVASEKTYVLNEEAIENEAMYDGYYAVVTNLDMPINEIIAINKRRWKIEECFRIMKTEFKSRPVYLSRQDRIKAHFLTCFISLLVYRLLEIILDRKYTTEELTSTLKSMKMNRLKESNGYTPSYKRTDLTDHLHEAFGFRTDYEIISKSRMRSIIKKSKEKKQI